MNVDTMARLFELKNIVGVKDATGDLDRVDQQLSKMGKEFIQLTGNDDNALEFNKRGGVGAISVTANIAPKLCSDFQKFSKSENDISEAEKLDKILQPIHHSMFVESNPSPVKYAAKLLNLCEDDVRLPLVKVTEQTKEIVKKVSSVSKIDLMNKKTNSGLKIICLNRKASFNYFFEDILEAGIVLKGSEIKSVRDGKVNIADSYAVEKNGEIILINSHISPYKQASYSNHNPTDERKLLLNKREINKLIGKMQRDGFTIVPTKMYFKKGKGQN